MKYKLSECLTAAGISRVVWIDDNFATPSRNELEPMILKAARELRDRGDDAVDLAKFGRLNLRLTNAQLEEAVVAICEPLSEAELIKIVAALGLTTGKSERRSQPDLSAEEFQQLSDAIGPRLRVFSLGTWTSGGVIEFRSAGEETLFLVDKEFTQEDTASDGIDLLDFLVKNTRGLCILLTHTCRATDQEQRRRDFANSKGLLPHSFCVVSKQQDADLSVDDRFAMAIRTAMTHKFNGGIAHTICETIKESAKNTAVDLTSQSVSDIERVLFENAEGEGVIEYDAVLRIFEIQQRHALNAALADEAIQRQLQLSRKFREASESLGIKLIPGDMSYFREMRAREIFFEGTGLNKLYSPLSCGDVFQTEKTGSRYVLLAQACELMVREDGERNAEFGLFAFIGDPKKEDPDEKAHADEKKERKFTPDYRYFDLGDVFGTGKKYVDFRKMFAVNLAVIELAVFNSDGTVQIRPDQPEPAIVLSKGLAVAFKHAKNSFFPKVNKPATKRPLGIGSRATSLEATTVSAELLRYPLRRIGRLQSVTATAVLAAWATFQTRAAFDHDFAKERDTMLSGKSAEASAESKPNENLAGAGVRVPVAAPPEATSADDTKPAGENGPAALGNGGSSKRDGEPSAGGGLK